MCWRNFCNFSLGTKKCEKKVKNSPFFQMSAILKFNFQKREQLSFSEVNYLNCTKKTQFCMWQLHFPQNKGTARTSHGPIPHPLRNMWEFMLLSDTTLNLLNNSSKQLNPMVGWIPVVKVYTSKVNDKVSAQTSIDNIANSTLLHWSRSPCLEGILSRKRVSYLIQAS